MAHLGAIFFKEMNIKKGGGLFLWENHGEIYHNGKYLEKSGLVRTRPFNWAGERGSISGRSALGRQTGDRGGDRSFWPHLPSQLDLYWRW